MRACGTPGDTTGRPRAHMSATNRASFSEPLGAEPTEIGIDTTTQPRPLRRLQQRWAHQRARRAVQRAGSLPRRRPWTRQRVVRGLAKHAPAALLDGLAVLLAHEVA